MPHFRVDDALHSHPKAQRAGDDAMGMWARAGSFCMAYLTDGFVPDWWVKQQPKGTAKAKKLVAAGLWIDGAEREGETGYQFHEFVGPGRQDSRAQIEAEREKWRKKKAGQRAMSPGDTPRDTTRMSPGDTKGESPQESSYARATRPRANTNTNPIKNSSTHLRDDPHQSNARDDDLPPEPPYDPDAEPPDTVVDHAPAHIDNAAKPTRRHPSQAALLVVRQELGPIGDPYPRTTHTRLATQVENLTREGHPDQRIRQALKEWDHRADCTKPEYLPTVLADLVKADRAQPGNNSHPTSKLRAVASLAARQRALENAQTTPKELE